jgi:hypothetical protein
MRTYPDIAIQSAQVLLPRPGIDLHTWAVIACDQFTSEPEYWRQVEQIVDDSPSTLNLILPEVFLHTPGEEERIRLTRAAMSDYLQRGLFQTHDGLILVERRVAGRVRHGLILALDLESYDFGKGSQTLIRATEGTILERIPPRVRIRSGAPLELPHILVLIDDPHRTVIEPLIDDKENLTPLYAGDLMLGSGHVAGLALDHRAEARVVTALRALADPTAFQTRYRVGADKGVLLFAMGDGNHSLATAKTIWEQIKASVGMDHPARYALVEIENVHDQGLIFEPIHRVMFGVPEELPSALRSRSIPFELSACSAEDMIRRVENPTALGQAVGLVSPAGTAVLTFLQPTSNLAVGTLQSFLDAWLSQSTSARIDYVHGADVVTRLGAQPGNLGFYLPALAKDDLFKTVILDGVLPRKTFSMGEAIEKRFYLEARLIT